jgi:hypothetical protein
METRHDMAFTLEQKGVLASVAEETGVSVSSLIDERCGAWQERRRAGQGHGHAHEDAEVEPPGETSRKPMWAKIREAFDRVLQEEMEGLPTDGAANVDYYAYGLPKRP